jgi:ArsR family metal-binding transcriptional regulator
LAVRAGLLIPAGDGYYTVKIPVVEYLVGSFYGWLVQPRNAASDSPDDQRRRQRFVSKFRQGFWWFEFDDIWLYAFDQLWRGSPVQVDMAHDVVVWLLDYSRRCMDAGQFTGELLPGQTVEDRRPFTCHRFAMAALLPVGPVSTAVDGRVEKLLNAGIKQLLEELLQDWRHLPHGDDKLDLLAERRPVELMRHLEPLLAAKSHKDVRFDVVYAIGTGLLHLEPTYVKEVVDTSLLPCLANAEYEEVWDGIVKALGEGLSHLEPSYVKEVVEKTLLPCLANAEYKHAWGEIAKALGNGLSRLEPADVRKVVDASLLPCLANADYKQVWEYIVNALGNGLSRLEPVHVKEVVDKSLVPCLANAQYEEVSRNIANALGICLSRLEPADVKEVVDKSLLPCLVNLEHKQEWEDFGDVLRIYLSRLEPVYVKGVVDKSLLPCLANANYKQCWSNVASVIGKGLAVLEPADVKKVVDKSLLPCLAHAEYKHAWGKIVHAIGNGFGRLEPADVKEIVDKSLLPCLANAEYKHVWEYIADAVGYGLSRLEPADAKEVVDKSLLPCLANAEFRHAWRSIAYAVGTGLARLEPVYVKEVVDKSLLPCLANAEYKLEWRLITYAVGTGLARLEPAHVKEVVDKSLLPCLVNVDYRHAWRNITDVIAANGQSLSGKQAQLLDQVFAAKSQHEHGWKIVTAAPKLRWFVRRIGDDLIPKRIIYVVCERNDPQLLFDGELACAPQSIKSIVDPQYPRADELRTSDVESPPTPQPRFIFRRTASKTWDVAFGSADTQKLHIHFVAFVYFAQLLERPGNEIKDIDLRFWDAPPLAAEAKRQVQDDVMPPDEKKEIEAEISRLQKQLVSEDPSEVAEAKEMLERLEKQLRRDTGFHGRQKGVRKSPAQQAQTLVEANIGKAINALELCGMADLAAHFRDHIKKTGTYGRHYVPDEPVPDWEVGWEIPKDAPRILTGD